jgi:hypothetical protein
MLKTIPAGDVDLDGRALAVRYKDDPAHPGFLLVYITAHQTDGEPDDVRRAEIGLIATAECMSREVMHARVRAEAARREIESVAWIEEADAERAGTG